MQVCASYGIKLKGYPDTGAIMPNKFDPTQPTNPDHVLYVQRELAQAYAAICRSMNESGEKLTNMEHIEILAALVGNVMASVASSYGHDAPAKIPLLLDTVMERIQSQLYNPRFEHYVRTLHQSGNAERFEKLMDWGSGQTH